MHFNPKKKNRETASLDLLGAAKTEKNLLQARVDATQSTVLQVETNIVRIFVCWRIQTPKGQQQTALHAQTKQDAGKC